MAIGGQCIVVIRGKNNEKLNLTTTSVELKTGTYAKIQRAIAMQKEIVFEDLVVGGIPVGSASYPLAIFASGGQDLVRLYIQTLASFVNIYDSDEAVVGSI